MKTVRINIASEGWLGEESLAGLAESREGLPVFSSIDGRLIGRTVSYGWIPPDLWAECELDDDATLAGATAAAIVICPTNETDPPPPLALSGVLVTRLSHDMIRRLGFAVGARKAGS